MSDLEAINPLKDKSNPRSIINITPSSVSKALEVIPESVWTLTEHELKEAGDITHTEDLLRIAFWREYDSAQQAQRNIVLSNIYGGVCSQRYFLKNVVGNSFRLAYVLCLPKDYELQMVDIMHLSMQRAREILTLPLTKRDGSFDGMLGNVIHKLLELSLDRVKGSVVKKVESKSLNLNLEGKEGPKPLDIDELDLAEVKRRLAQLESVSSSGEVIDVESKESLSSEES